LTADFDDQMNAFDLDDVEAVRRVDGSGMLELTGGYARQWREGLKLAEEQFHPGADEGPFERVALLGTGGGSAASGQLLRSYLFRELPVPFIVNQGYNVPGFVDERTLALVVTHSGNTEETLQAFEKARRAGAYVVAITAGGRLWEMVRADGLPHVRVPGGLMPRAALGYIYVPILVILHRLGLIEDPRPAIEETVQLFERLAERYGPQAPLAENRAKQIARELAGKIPIVYGALETTDAVAWRWKNQLGENSKVMAFWNAVPALHHDEIVGWDGPPELTRPFGVVFLRDPEDPPKISKRIDITAQILRERAGAVIEAEAEPGGLLARLFSLVHLGDYVSCYLPILRGVDPTPVAVIDLFKRKMAEPS